MTNPPEARELRLVFYPGTGGLLQSFAVFEGETLVAFGFVGNEVCIALNDRPSLWYNTPGSDVPAALRDIFSTQLCKITIEEESDGKAVGSQRCEGVLLP